MLFWASLIHIYPISIGLLYYVYCVDNPVQCKQSQQQPSTYPPNPPYPFILYVPYKFATHLPKISRITPHPNNILVEEFAPKLRRLSHKMCVCVVNLCVSVCIAPIQRQMDTHTHTDPHTHHHHRSINPLRVFSFCVAGSKIYDNQLF